MERVRSSGPLRLQGEVEIDGAYIGSRIRPANIRTNWVDRRLLQYRTGKHSVIVVFRQRGGRTLTRAFLREAEGVSFAQERIEPGSSVSADEVAHWDLLAGRFVLRRVNHSEAYSENGVNTNLAENYFSRLRQMIREQHHAVGGKYLASYARHAAWLEGHSLESNGALADRLIRGRPCRARQQDLVRLLAATRKLTDSPAAQTHVPVRFSTMRTSLRRAACLSACTILKTTELRSIVSVTSRFRSTITLSARSRVDNSPSLPSCCTQMSAISPFLKKPWLTM
jgi:hypothetical protein